MKIAKKILMSLYSLVLLNVGASAAVYYVGNCNAAGFGSINAAVGAVPAGSTINVCPGTYAEQIVISKALTLQGMNINNSSQAVITVPSGGLATATTPSIYWSNPAAQIEINAGPVNVTNITVDGTAASADCPSGTPMGIYYGSGSSGTVTGVETRNQNCNGSGVGIDTENVAAGGVHAVKIQNSHIHDSNYGIFTCSLQSPTSTLTTTITGNYIDGTDFGIVAYCSASGVISANTVAARQYGVFVTSASTTISGNTVTGGVWGIDIQAATSITSNHIFNTTLAIFLDTGSSGASVKTNTITNSTIGVAFSCNNSTVTGNTINGATKGFDYVPPSFSGANKFYNVATVRNRENCA